jgi:hypothetical protein
MGKFVECWTVVQHSGFGYGSDPTFSRGLETREISKAAERDLVLQHKGVLFGSDMAAEQYCEVEMYRQVPEVLIPEAPGQFCLFFKIDGLRIYVPKGSA